MAVVEVRLEDVLVDGVALLGIDLSRVLLWEPVQGLLHGDANGRPCALLLAPVEHELLALRMARTSSATRFTCRSSPGLRSGPGRVSRSRIASCSSVRPAETARASSSTGSDS